MPAPTFRATGTIATAATNTMPIVIPATAVVGDIAFAHIATDDETNSITLVPSGWTHIATDTSNGSMLIALYYATVTSGGANDPGATVTWTKGTSSTDWAGVISCYAGHDTATPLPEAAVRKQQSGTSNLPILGAITTSVTDSMLIGFVTSDLATGEANSYTAASLTERYDQAQNAGGLHIAGYDLAAGAAGTYGPYNVSSTVNDLHIGYLVALAPSGAARDLEGFRWRNDDGNETAATWTAAQDVGITASNTATRRLRTIVDAAGDPDPAAYKLQYRRSTDTLWEDLTT